MATHEWQARARKHLDPYEDWRLKLNARSKEQGGDGDEIEGITDSGANWVAVRLRVKHPRQFGDGEGTAREVLGRVRDMIVPQPPRSITLPKLLLSRKGLDRFSSSFPESTTEEDALSSLSQGYFIKGQMRLDDIFDQGAYREDYPFELRFAAPEALQPFWIGTGADQRQASSSQRPLDEAVGDRETADGQERSVITAVIDDGIAFANARFCTKHQGGQLWRTRFLAVWLQDLEQRPASSGDVDYGYLVTKAQLDGWLLAHSDDVTGAVNERAVYRSAGINARSHRAMNVYRSATHGAHVADVACGYDPEHERSDRPIIGVQLPSVITEETSGRAFAHYALDALEFVFEQASALKPGAPLIVNLSYGFQAGLKDGSSFLEREIDRLVDERKRKGEETYLYLPAGNSFAADTNARFDLPTDTGRFGMSVEWEIQPDDRTESFLQIVARGSEGVAPNVAIVLKPPHDLPRHTVLGHDQQDVQVLFADPTDPKGGFPLAAVYIEEFPFTSSSSEDSGPRGEQGQSFLVACNRTNSRDSGLAHLAPLRPGRWVIEIQNRSTHSVSIQVMVQRDDTLAGDAAGGRQSVLDHQSRYRKSRRTGAYLDREGSPINGENTLSALTGGKEPRVVGASDDGAIVPDLVGATAKDVLAVQPQPAHYTAAAAEGLSSDPNLSAVVDHGASMPGLYASGTVSGSMRVLNGTSVAAPLAARAHADELIGLSKRQFQQPPASQQLRQGARRLARNNAGHDANDYRLKRAQLR
ncbi:MAG: hypothetical protein AAF739_16245 [Pseudomonadota bacterium]